MLASISPDLHQPANGEHHPTLTPGLRTPQLLEVMPELAAMTAEERRAAAPSLIGEVVLAHEIIDVTLVPPDDKLATAERQNRALTIYDSTEAGSYNVRNLRPREVHLFNLLLLRKGNVLEWGEFERLDYQMRRLTKLARYSPADVRCIASQLVLKLGSPLFDCRTDEGLSLRDNVVIIDKRPEISPPVAAVVVERTVQLANMSDPQLSPKALPAPEAQQSSEQVPLMDTKPAFTSFGGNEAREAAIIAMITQYKEHPSVKKALEALRRPISIPATEDLFNQYLAEVKSYGHLSMKSEDILEQFRIFEQGVSLLDRSQRGEDIPTDFLEERLIAATIAYQTVHLTTMRINYITVRKLGLEDVKGGVSKLDLIQEGNFGLIKAIQQFDYTRGVQFWTYAHYWVAKSIWEAYHRRSSIPMSRYDEINWRKIQSALGQDDGRMNYDEIAKKTGLTPLKVENLMGRARRVTLSADDVNDEMLKEPAAQSTSDKDGERQESNRQLLLSIIAAAYLKTGEKLAMSLWWKIPLEELEEEWTGPGGTSYQKIFEEVAFSETGLTLKEIGALCGLKENTLCNYLVNAKKKMMKVGWETRNQTGEAA